MFEINYTDDAVSDLKRLKKNEPKAYQKAIRFIDELREHPKKALGIPNR